MYPQETLDPEEDCGVMPENVAELEEAVIGRCIVSAETQDGHTVITLDNGRRVTLVDTSDCCAYTRLEDFLLHPEAVDHMILGVGTTDGYETWHIYADFGDVMKMSIGWSAGNPFYYGYGFEIRVEKDEVFESLEEIAHDLDPSCECLVCTKVREIKEKYEG